MCRGSSSDVVPLAVCARENEMKLVFGEKIHPEPIEKPNDADNVWGQSWHAWRDGDGFVLDYDSGDLAGHHRRMAIDADEFTMLRADREAFLRIVRNHGG
jgi:hypothetical protein